MICCRKPLIRWLASSCWWRKHSIHNAWYSKDRMKDHMSMRYYAFWNYAFGSLWYCPIWFQHSCLCLVLIEHGMLQGHEETRVELYYWKRKQKFWCLWKCFETTCVICVLTYQNRILFQDWLPAFPSRDRGHCCNQHKNSKLHLGDRSHKCGEHLCSNIPLN